MTEPVQLHHKAMLVVGSVRFVGTIHRFINLSKSHTLKDGKLKDFCLETVRPDSPDPHQETIFESVTSLDSVGTGSNGQGYTLFRRTNSFGSASNQELIEYFSKQTGISQIK